MAAPKTWKGVVGRYDKSPKRVREYFTHVPKLAEQFPWDVLLAWMFARVEQAWNMAVYCGVVKLHRANASLARTAVDKQHMTRQKFWELFEVIYGKPVKKEIRALIEEALDIRDRIMHGKTVSEADKRKAVVDILEYAEAFNDFVNDVGGLQPFGDLRGFKGRGKALDKSTTRFLLRGVGLEVL